MLFADLPWEKAKPKDADFRLFCTLGGVSSRLHPFHYTSPPMMQFLRMVLNIIPKHRPSMANCADFFSRKIAFYVTDKSNLKIAYGLKEIKDRSHKTKEWEFNTGAFRPRLLPSSRLPLFAQCPGVSRPALLHTVPGARGSPMFVCTGMLGHGAKDTASDTTSSSSLPSMIDVVQQRSFHDDVGTKKQVVPRDGNATHATATRK